MTGRFCPNEDAVAWFKTQFWKATSGGRRERPGKKDPNARMWTRWGGKRVGSERGKKKDEALGFVFC